MMTVRKNKETKCKMKEITKTSMVMTAIFVMETMTVAALSQILMTIKLTVIRCDMKTRNNWIYTYNIDYHQRCSHCVPFFQQHFSYHLSCHHWLVLLQLAGLLLGKPPCQQKWGEKVTGAWQSIRGKVAIKLKRYLITTIKQATATTHMKVITWGKFEKGVGAFPDQQVLKRHKPILNQDLVVVPWNIDNSHYWFLLPVQPPL